MENKKNKIQFLFNCVIGSRGDGSHTFLSDLNVVSLVYYGDERDNHGPRAVRNPIGTFSLWPFPWFKDKLFRYQWEALELFFSSVNNIISFDPVLMPLWLYREDFLTHELLDKIVERSSKDFCGLLRKNELSPTRVMSCFSKLMVVQQVLRGNRFEPQLNPWNFFDRNFISRLSSKKHLKGVYQKLTKEIFDMQMQQLRAPTEREIYRGEEPFSPIPGIMPPSKRKKIKSVGNKVWNKIKAGKTGRTPTLDHLPFLSGIQSRRDFQHSIRSGRRPRSVVGFAGAGSLGELLFPVLNFSPPQQDCEVSF